MGETKKNTHHKHENANGKSEDAVRAKMQRREKKRQDDKPHGWICDLCHMHVWFIMKPSGPPQKHPFDFGPELGRNPRVWWSSRHNMRRDWLSVAAYLFPTVCSMPPLFVFSVCVTWCVSASATVLRVSVCLSVCLWRSVTSAASVEY